MGALGRRAWIPISHTFLIHTWVFHVLEFTPILSNLIYEEFRKQEIFLIFFSLMQLWILNKLYNIEQETSTESKLKI